MAFLPTLLVFTTFFATHARAETLSLTAYLNQVATQSPGYEASQSNAEGARLSAREGDLYYNPKFNMKASHQYDARQVSGILAGTQTIDDNFSLGIDKTFDIGLKTSLNYTFYNNLALNVSPQLAAFGSFNYVSSLTELDVEQPLWRNGFGKETRAMSEKDEATSLQIQFNERLNAKKLIAQAESTYYRLAIARESVKLQSDVLDRSKKILDWSTKRVNNHLADRSDMLQSKAAHQLRQIELEQTLNEQRAAALAFNVLRNSSSEEVSAPLESISSSKFLNLQAPRRAEKTDDVLAAEQGERFAVANNETSLQKVQPELTAFGSLAVNGVSTALSSALSQNFSTNNPMYLIGLRFSMPLYFGEASDIRAGRMKQQFAAEANTREKKLESDQTWDDLTKKFVESKARLKLVEELVAAQKEKLDWEKHRFSLGRTTTYQVLTFEQDYAQALITRLKNEQEMIGYYSQMKIYASTTP